MSECFHLGKDAGYKIVAHMMPDLPNVGYERDMRQFQEFFENPAFRTDGLKIYPTLVIRGTGLYELWKTGRYLQISQAIHLLVACNVRSLPWIPQVQELFTRISGRRGGQHSRTGSAMDADLSHPERYPYAAGYVGGGEWQSQRTGTRQNEGAWVEMSGCSHPGSRDPGDPQRR